MKTSTKSKESTGRKAFKYRGRDRTAEDVAKASKISSGSFDSYIIQGVNTFKPREGENNIRILPMTWEDEDKWGKEWAIILSIHHSIGADNSAYLCIDKMNDEDCPICQARNDASEEEAKELRVNKRALVWIIDRDNEKAGPMAWAMPLTLYKDVQIRSIDKESKEVIYIDDPDEGFDISFNKEGTGLHTKYATVEIARKGTAISDNPKRQARWLDLIAAQPLPDILNFYDAEYITKVLEGKSSRKDADDEDDEDDKPTRKRSKVTNDKRKSDEDEDEDDEADERAARSNKRRVAKDEDDETEEETEDEDTEDEEDEKPVRSKGKGRKPAKDEDEDDEEAEDEDDEDEPPTRSKRKVAKEDDEDESEGEDDEDDEPKRKSTKRKGKASDDDEDEEPSEDEDDSEEETEDEDEDEAPKGKSTASSRAKAKLEALKKKKGGR